MPSETISITLSRALKLKNRLVHRLAQLDGTIIGFNSAPEGNQEFDVRELYKARMVLAARLVQLKAAITAANQPIQGQIFELAECKSLIGMLNKIDTRHGSIAEGYAGVRVNYVAQFRKPDVDRETHRVEQEIDRIQDELDQFNHRTSIEVIKGLLAEEQAEPDWTG